MGAALVATLLNEEKALPEFLDSVLSQTRPPQEIILVDGGSQDHSREIIQRYIDNGAPIRLLAEKGANRSQGRNAGIKHASQQMIAVSDVGCRLKEDWLERITAPLERGEAEVASGYYAPEAQDLIGRAIAAATVPSASEVNPKTFLPSSRSVAFLKSAWEKAGGYPEWTIFSEDTLFDLALDETGAAFCFVPEAIVFWKQQTSLASLFRQFYRYACSDGKAKLFFGHYRKAFLLSAWKIGLIAVALLAMTALPWVALSAIGLLALTALGYIARYLRRSRKRGWDWAAALISPVAMAVVDTANFAGYLSGIFARTRNANNRS